MIFAAIVGTLLAGTRVYSAVKGGRVAKDQAERRSQVAVRSGEIDSIFAAIQENQLLTYADALEQTYNRQQLLNLRQRMRADRAVTRAAAQRDIEHGVREELFRQQGILNQGVYLDRLNELEQRDRLRTSRFERELETIDFARGVNEAELRTDLAAVRTRAQGQRLVLDDTATGFQERAVGLQERLLEQVDREAVLDSRLRQAGEQQGRFGLQIAAGRAQTETQLAELALETGRQAESFGRQGLIARAQARREAELAREAEAQAAFEREERAVATIADAGQRALRQSASGVSFSSASLADRRRFREREAVKGTIRRITQIQQQAKGHRMTELIRRHEAAIADYNLEHIKTYEAVRGSNLRLQQALREGNVESQSRELAHQQDLLQVQKLHSLEGQQLTGNRTELLGARMDRHQQRYHLLNVEEALSTTQAETKYQRREVTARRQDDAAHTQYLAEGLQLLAGDNAAQQAFRQSYLSLANTRLGEDARYDRDRLAHWRQRQAIAQAFDSAELNRFRAQRADEFNLNTRLAGLYQGWNKAQLQQLTGEAIMLGGNFAQIMGYVGGLDAALSYGLDVYERSQGT